MDLRGPGMRSSRHGGGVASGSWIPRQKKNAKLMMKIYQVGVQNPASWGPKSTKLGSKIKKNQSWEGSGGGHGAILDPRGPKTLAKGLPLKVEQIEPGHFEGLGEQKP